jgi:hypothetical protein
VKRAGISAALLAGAFALQIAPPAAAKANGGKSCIKRRMAKSLSECSVKAKCNGVISRTDQARLCP